VYGGEGQFALTLLSVDDTLLLDSITVELSDAQESATYRFIAIEGDPLEMMIDDPQDITAAIIRDPNDSVIASNRETNADPTRLRLRASQTGVYTLEIRYRADLTDAPQGVVQATLKRSAIYILDDAPLNIRLSPKNPTATLEFGVWFDAPSAALTIRQADTTGSAPSPIHVRVMQDNRVIGSFVSGEAGGIRDLEFMFTFDLISDSPVTVELETTLNSPVMLQISRQLISGGIG
jgi:hypothetical protein